MTLKKEDMWAPRLLEWSYYKHKWPFIKRNHKTVVTNFGIDFAKCKNNHISIKIPGLIEIPHPFQTSRMNHENGSYLNFAHENSVRLIAAYNRSSNSITIFPYVYANGMGPAFGHSFNKESFLTIGNNVVLDKYTLSINKLEYQFSFKAWLDNTCIADETRVLPSSYKCSHFCTSSWIHARGYHGPNSPCDIDITID